MDRLAVDNTCSTSITDRTVQQLEEMVKLGREAERALADIAAKGYADGFFPLVEGRSEPYNGRGHGRPTYNVVEHQLAKYVSPRRDIGPPLGDLEVLLEGYENGPSGTVFKQCTLFVQGTLFRQTATPNEHILLRQKMPFGHLRFLKSGYSIQICAPQEQKETELCGGGDVVQLYTNFTYPQAKESAKKIAAGLAVAIVRKQYEVPEDQLTADMRTKVEKWLLDEGHVERLCTTIREMAKVHEVMHA